MGESDTEEVTEEQCTDCTKCPETCTQNQEQESEQEKLIEVDVDGAAENLVATGAAIAIIDGPAPVADVPAAGVVVTGLATLALFKAGEDFVNKFGPILLSFSKTARGNQKDTELQGLTAEDIAEELSHLTGNKLTKEQKARKRKLQKEQKARGQRNKQKKGSEKGTGTGRR
ncbi:MAG: hypothetical protein AAF600_16075 [Bacteroidota bacterium]